MSLRSTCSAAVLALAVGAAMASPASAASDHRTVKVLDDCDPVTFNAVIGPGSCVGDGRTTVDEFGAEFGATNAVAKWAFKPEHFKIRAGGVVTAESRGGEFHTFTPVDEFGSGCVPDLALRGAPATPPEVCGAAFAGAYALPPGATLSVPVGDAGTQRFQCLIHPWMQATVEVRAHHHH